MDHVRQHRLGHSAVSLTLFAAALLFVIALKASADTVTLNTGRKIEGIIDADSTTESSVVIRTPAGVVTVPRANVAEISQDQDIGYGEASGDLAALAGDLDRARFLYESALAANPGDKALAEKLDSLLERINQRDERKYGAPLDRIRQALNAGEYQQAITLSHSLMERAPEDSIGRRCRQSIVDAYLGIARRHRQAAQWAAARSAYLSAFETAPEDPLPPLELAEMLSETPGEKLAAIAYFNQAFDLAEKHPGKIDDDRLLNAQFILGRDYFVMNNYPLATVTLLNVMRKDSQFKHPEAIDLAVEAYGKIGASSSPEDRREIVNNLQALILIYQNNSRAILLLGRVYFDMDNWAGAVDTLKTLTAAPEADPADPVIQEALYYQSVALRHLGHYPAAATSLQRIVDSGGGSYDVLTELGELRLRETRYKDAYDLFEKALTLDPTQARAHFDMGKVLAATSLHDEAQIHLNKAAGISPSDPEIRYEIARNYLAKGNYDEAIKLGRGIVRFTLKNVETSPTTGQARLLADCFMLLGEANERLGNRETARQRYAKATTYEPERGRGHEAIALSFQADGLHKEAQEAFEKAASLEPGNAGYVLNLGIHWHQVVKNPRKALPYYLKYLQLGGQNPLVPAWIEECGGTPPS